MARFHMSLDIAYNRAALGFRLDVQGNIILIDSLNS